MYWTGVRDKLNNILLTLVRQKNKPSYHKPLRYETLDRINPVQDYEPFLRNICYNPRSSSSFIGFLKGGNQDDRLRDT